MRPHVPPSRRAAMGRFARWLSLSAGLAVAASCAVGPNYHRPKVDAAPDYKEAGDWKPSEPGDALSRGPWWEIFGDDALNQLEVRIAISNQNVKAAAAAFDQARALVAQARAGFWPTVSASVSRQHSEAGAGNGTGVPVTASVARPPAKIGVMVESAPHDRKRLLPNIANASEPARKAKKPICGVNPPSRAVAICSGIAIAARVNPANRS